jgi:homoaconitase/3-isopropylmalate dehydratase large subunit
MHTEFVRERAQPGMLCIGADSHSCSAGAVSCLSIGMGSTDVCMPLLTGQTWFEVPKTVDIRFIGKPSMGVSGKDVILYILGQFKRNTIAADRVVEFTGPGLEFLSCDARFAIANMCTVSLDSPTRTDLLILQEFGAVTGIFEADERTFDFVQKRRHPKHRNSSVYYCADSDAEYDARYDIDLSLVEPFVARYPSPDDVVPVGQVAGTKLDGVFIGACTTAEEDLITAALVLKAGLDQGMNIAPGRRVVVPGSKPIRHKLQQLGLLDVYVKAGFKVGVPGCSMCIGQGVDQAREGEVWLSSQNRNFANRMGRGKHCLGRVIDPLY